MIGTDERESQPDRIAQEFDRLAPRVGPKPANLEALRPLARLDFGGGRRRRLDLFRHVDARGFREIADEAVLERCAATLFDQFLRRADGEHLAGVHQRDAVAAIGFVHEMGGDENRHAVVAREVDQRPPERVARDRVDARRRLVENEDGGFVQHRDRKLEPSA